MIENAEAPNQIGFVNLLNNEMGFVKDVRLPRHVLPVSYNLSLIPFIIENNYTIDGNIRIESNIVEAENNCDDKVFLSDIYHSRRYPLNFVWAGTIKELYTGTPNSDIRILCTVHCERNVKPSAPTEVEVELG